MGVGQGPPRGDLTNPVHAARQDPALVVLEGLHAVKHALRFGAVVEGLWSDRPDAVLALAAELAPDIVAAVSAALAPVTPARFGAMAERPPETRLIAVARRPAPAAPGVDAPLLLLDRPRHPGNLGAVIRVAAAADAAAVWSLGGVDPWSAAVVRGAAGLHFALPVQAIGTLPETGRPVIALDDGGTPLVPAELPVNGLYLFGSERDGLAPALLARADARLAIPMRSGVSSLNLATAAAVLLYALRLRPAVGDGPGTGQGRPLST